MISLIKPVVLTILLYLCLAWNIAYAESPSVSPPAILEVRVEKIQSKLRQIINEFNDSSYLSSQERIVLYEQTYQQVEQISLDYQDIYQQLATTFTQDATLSQVDQTIRQSLPKILAILTELKSRNQQKIKDLERELLPQGYTREKLQRLNVAVLRNSTQEFLLVKEINTLLSSFQALDENFNQFYLINLPQKPTEYSASNMSSFLTFLALFLMITALSLIVFAILSFFWKKRKQNNFLLEKKVNKLIENLNLIEKQLELHDRYLSRITQDIRIHIVETNRVIACLQEDLNHRYIDKHAYRQELNELKTLINQEKKSSTSAADSDNTNIALLQEKNQKLESKLTGYYLHQYLTIYNQNPEAILQCRDLTYYEVREAPESETRRLTTKQPEIILEQPLTGAGLFWVIKFTHLDPYYLFPRQLEISEAQSYTIQAIFTGYKPQAGQSFILQQPALVMPGDNQTWKLVKKGAISL